MNRIISSQRLPISNFNIRIRQLIAVATVADWISCCLCFVSVARGQTPDPNTGSSLLAAKSGDSIVIESKGGAQTYKAIIDPKAGGNITQVSLRADGSVVARELNDIFFHGKHGEEYTLRGWTKREQCIVSCKMDLVSQLAMLVRKRN